MNDNDSMICQCQYHCVFVVSVWSDVTRGCEEKGREGGVKTVHNSAYNPMSSNSERTSITALCMLQCMLGDSHQLNSSDHHVVLYL